MSQDGISIEDPFPTDEPTPEETTQIAVTETEDDAEPDGVLQVGDKRLVDVSVVAAERKRARELAEKKVRETELAPLQEKAKEIDSLKAAVAELRPYADFLKQHPHLMQQPPPAREEDSITDEQAATYARRYELFDAQSGQPDIKRAKAIIADHRKEQADIAKQAAQEAIAPLQAQTAEQATRDNFLQAIQYVKDDDIVTPELVAQQFAELGTHLTQHPQVARVALERAIGRAYLERRQGSRRPARAPVLSESPGGQAPQSVPFTERAKKMGLSEADLKSAHKTFKPGDVSEIGSW